MFLMYAYDVFFSNGVSNFIFSTNRGQWENIWINLKLKSYTFKVLYISQPTYQSSLSNIFQLVNYLILAYTEQNLKQEKECLFYFSTLLLQLLLSKVELDASEKMDGGCFTLLQKVALLFILRNVYLPNSYTLLDVSCSEAATGGALLKKGVLKNFAQGAPVRESLFY